MVNYLNKEDPSPRRSMEVIFILLESVPYVNLLIVESADRSLMTAFLARQAGTW